MTWTLVFGLFLSFYQGIEELKVYQVKKIDSPLEITGKGDNPVWDQAALLTDFQQPWNKELAQPTSFRALWDEDYYYFFYDAIDLDIVAPGETRDKRNVLPSDRIEIFFKVNGQMNPYYCLEMDPKGRVLDYEAQYYREVDLTWSWPDGELEVKSKIKNDGYTVEGKISLNSLRDLGILDESMQMEVGLFRGDFYRVGANQTDVRWVSWVIPEADTPDFHIPSAFGKLMLAEE